MLTNEEKQRFLQTTISELIRDGDHSEAQKMLRDLLMSDTNGGKLYKFRSFKKDRLRDLLEEQTLYCSKPSVFNDPFDCKFGVDFNSLAEAVCGLEADRINLLLDKYFAFRRGTTCPIDISDSERKIIEAWSHSKKLNQLLDIAQSGTLKTDEKSGQYLLEHFDALVELLRPVVENSDVKGSFHIIEQFYPRALERMSPTGIMSLSDNPLSLTDYAKANHIEEDSDEIGLLLAINRQLGITSEKSALEVDTIMTQLGKQVARVLDDRFFIGCLCPDYKNRLMWSHYADGHKGYCIEYDFSQSPDDLLPLPVVYTRTRPKIPWRAAIHITDETKEEASRTFMTALLTKDDAWEYEREWRLLISSTMHQQVKMPPITCVYLGALCPPDDAEAIVEIAERRSIPLKQMVVDRGEYALHAQIVNTDSHGGEAASE